jgi:hypothetical protein
MIATFSVYQLSGVERIRSTDFYSYKVDGDNAVLFVVSDSVDNFVSDYPTRNYWRIIGDSGHLKNEEK